MWEEEDKKSPSSLQILLYSLRQASIFPKFRKIGRYLLRSTRKTLRALLYVIRRAIVQAGLPREGERMA